MLRIRNKMNLRITAKVGLYNSIYRGIDSNLLSKFIKFCNTYFFRVLQNYAEKDVLEVYDTQREYNKLRSVVFSPLFRLRIF